VPNQPQPDDVILGGQNLPPSGSVILGGVEGVQRRLASRSVEQRVAALSELKQYGQAGLDLLIEALQDEAIPVQKAAYLLLQNGQSAQAKRALQAYDPYVLFDCLVTLKGHTRGITSVAISPDGRTIVSGSRDGVIKVWDWWAQEEIFTIQAWSIVYSITISADGRTFAIQGKNKQVKAWSLRNGQEIAPEEEKLRSIASVTRSEDNHLISGSQNLIKIWNLKTGQEICSLCGHTSLVTSVAVSLDQQVIVSGSEDRTVRVWGVA
jgi:WD40 repeat protein